MKLTKKEKNFLLDWLKDDLDLQIENGSSKLIINNLKSITKKMERLDNEKKIYHKQ